MEKLNKVFVPQEFVNNNLLEQDSMIHKMEQIDNGVLFTYKDVLGVNNVNNTEGLIEKRYTSGTPDFYSDLLKFFGNKYKYYELHKIVQGIPRFKANLFRYATLNLFDETILKNMYNYTGYDRYRCPLEYTMYKTDPNKDSIEGISDGVFYLSYGDSPEQKIVLEQYQNWTGSLTLQAYSPNRELTKQMYKTIFSWMKDNNFLKNKKIDMNGDFLSLSGENWSDMILNPTLETLINKHLLKYIERYEELVARGVNSSRGFLLYGGVGMGKSYLGRVMANQLNTTFIWVPHSSGDSGDYSQIYGLAKELAPTIVFLEDLASHGGMDRRGGSSSNVLGELLNILSGVEKNNGVITFATENYIDNLDVALRRRAGRFDYIIEMKNLDLEGRIKFLTKFLPEYSTIRIKMMADNSSEFTCAELKELVNRSLIENGSPEDDLQIILDMRNMFGIKEKDLEELDLILNIIGEK